MKRYVLDSYAMIAYFEDEPGADRGGADIEATYPGQSKRVHERGELG